MSKGIKFFLKDNEYAMITLNRPNNRNAITKQTIEELKDALEKAKAEPIKCLIITGEGDKAFCSGGDLHEFHSDLTTEEAFSLLYQMKEVLFEIARFPVPTIAFLNGHAMGGGCELATACDFRYAKNSSKFGFIQGRLGITPGWGGGALLYHRINPLHAYEMLVSSNVYTTGELMGKGWLQGTYEEDRYDELFQEVISTFTKKDVEQIQLFKTQYKKQQIPVYLSTEMDEEVRNCANLWGNETHKRALQEFLER